jgi:hypothetical protein
MRSEAPGVTLMLTRPTSVTTAVYEKVSWEPKSCPKPESWPCAGARASWNSLANAMMGTPFLAGHTLHAAVWP